MEKRSCQVCRGALSRYISEPVCAACAPQIATTPPFPMWLWDSVPLRRAFAELDLGALAVSGDIAGAVDEGVVVLHALDKGRIMSPRILDTLQPVRQAAAVNRTGDDFCSRYDRRTGDLAT